MSAGFRSWLAGVIGRFSSTPGVPPPVGVDGVGVSDGQSFAVLQGGNLLGVYADTQSFVFHYDLQHWVVISEAHPMPLIYGSGKQQ